MTPGVRDLPAHYAACRDRCFHFQPCSCNHERLQWTLNVADLMPPLAVAEIFTVVFAPTGCVLTRKVALALLARTVTDVGIEATAVPPLTTARVTTGS